MAAPAAADSYDLTLPKGTRAVATDRYVSGRGFRDTYDHFARLLDKRGVAHRAVPPYRARGVDVGRFVSEVESTPWLAIHVYRVEGKTMIFLVKRPPPLPVPANP